MRTSRLFGAAVAALAVAVTVPATAAAKPTEPDAVVLSGHKCVSAKQLPFSGWANSPWMDLLEDDDGSRR